MMPEKNLKKNIRLGIFVILGTSFLITALYLMGNKQNLFGDTFRVSALFNNVSGLMTGNNVRFSGIDVGTVESVEIVNDSSVKVVMVIERGVQPFIMKNAVVSIGTDGLMGNKLVNINSVKETAPGISEGDVLKTLRPIETDEMLRTLNRTNDNVAVITENLRTITEKVNSPNTLWSLLMDTLVAQNVKQAIVSIRLTGTNSALLSGDLRAITKDVKDGKGSIGALLTDQSFAQTLQQSIVKIKVMSDTMALVTGDLHDVSQKIKKGEGAVGTLLMDTAFVRDLNTSLDNIRNGAGNFNDNMEALKHVWPFKRYFRKQAKNKK